MDNQTKCGWKLATDKNGVSDGYYETKCGNAFVFFDGTPKENEFVFCPYCGKKIKGK